MGGLAKHESVIEWSARLTGWAMFSRRGDFYTVQSRDRPGNERLVSVKYRDGDSMVKFTTDFPIRFSLERTPQGLFARLLLRSVPLCWSHWNMDIDQACEAQPYLVAVWPTAVMTPKMFDAICREMVGELRSFHQELRDKLAYGVGGGMVDPARAQGRAEVPQARHDRGTLPDGKDGRWMLE
jgi:hypothetical protein